LLNSIIKVIGRGEHKMTLIYYFNGNWFEKDISQSDIEEYIRTLPKREIAELVKDSFYLWTKEEQHDILVDIGEPNFACPDFERWVDDEWELCMDLIMEVDTLDRLEDELHDYFEYDAMREYENEPEEPSDPYVQRGLSRLDFN
jgi:hypothetical protein